MGRIHGLLVAVCLLAAGCGHGGFGSRVRPEQDPRWLFLADVPFVAQQQQMDCGAAALAMALGHGGHRTSVAEIASVVAADPDKGIFAGRLRDYARRRGFEAYLIAGTWDDLTTELGRGHPVLVGLVKTANRRKFSHYEVVIGVRRDGTRIITLDPASGRRERSAKKFLAEWAPAEYAALVVWRGARSAPALLPAARHQEPRTRPQARRMVAGVGKAAVLQ